MDNLFENIPEDSPEEIFQTLMETDTIRIERIVSRGHSSPKEGWYDQEQNEWVVLLIGSARLSFEDGREILMKPGDWLNIPAHDRHRVDWTAEGQETIWLAVHHR